MIDPQDIDPDTGLPYEGYSSPALDTSFHDHEMDVEDDAQAATRALEGLLRLEQDGVSEDEARIIKELKALPIPSLAIFARAIDAGMAAAGAAQDDPDACTNPGGHEFVCTGTAYGGDDERWHGEGRCLCIHCGADGDA